MSKPDKDREWAVLGVDDPDCVAYGATKEKALAAWMEYGEDDWEGVVEVYRRVEAQERTNNPHWSLVK